LGNLPRINSLFCKVMPCRVNSTLYQASDSIGQWISAWAEIPAM
jgi:hypothetical protein